MAKKSTKAKKAAPAKKPAQGPAGKRSKPNMKKDTVTCCEADGCFEYIKLGEKFCAKHTPAEGAELIAAMAARIDEPKPAKKEVWLDVKSTDERKPAISDRLKRASGCRKVTMVQINKAGDRVRGNCMNPNSDASLQGLQTFPLAPEPKKISEAKLAKVQAVADEIAADINAALAAPDAKAALAKAAAPVTQDLNVAEGAAAFLQADKDLQRGLAMSLTRQLVSDGHRVTEMAAACGVTDGSVYRWYRATSAPTGAQYGTLLGMAGKPPANGSRRAPGATAARSARRTPTDVRQLMLELRDLLTAQLEKPTA